MARRRAVRVTRPARLGFAALVIAILLAAGFYLTLKLVRGSGGYQIGVRFRQAAGVAPGAQVFMNGVNVGGVAKVKILPDTTVDFIINVYRDTAIPRSAKFSAQTSITGTPSVTITVPPGAVASSDVWPKRVLPLPEQPVGVLPLTLEDFMGQSRALGDRAQRVLAQARPYGGRLMHHLQNSRANGAATMQDLHETLPALMGSLQTTIAKAKANAKDAQAALREHDQAKLAQTADAFERTTADMQKTSASLQAIKRDPQLANNTRAATAQLREAMANMAKLSRDMQMISGNPQTKAELRDAGARLRALLQKI